MAKFIVDYSRFYSRFAVCILYVWNVTKTNSVNRWISQIHNVLRDLVPLVQFKNVFSRFLNCTNGTKSGNASQFVQEFALLK